MKKILTTLLMALLPIAVFAASPEDDVNFYVKKFSQGQSFDLYTIESLGWKGISDPRVFDLIEQRANQFAADGANDSVIRKQVAWYIRALGFSGQFKYSSTIQQFMSDRSYRGYADDALEDLPSYEKWNPLISNRATFDPQYSDDVNRILNMLRSDDFGLKKIGAKRIYYQNKEPVLLDALADQIKVNYMDVDPKHSDTIAWMVKGLGSAKQPKYRELLQEVAWNARDKAVVRHAKNELTR